MNKPEREFLEHLRLDRGYSEKTVDNYRRDIDRFFVFLDGRNVLFDQVDKRLIRDFLSNELDRGVTTRSSSMVALPKKSVSSQATASSPSTTASSSARTSPTRVP